MTKLKNLSKRLFALLLCLCMVASAIPMNAFADDPEEPEIILAEPEAPAADPVQEEADVPTRIEAEETAPEAAAEETEPETEPAVPEEEPADEVQDDPSEVPEEAMPVSVHFHCDPADLTLTVWQLLDGMEIAIASGADGTYSLWPGEYRYEAEREGFDPAQAFFTVNQNGSMEISVSLNAVIEVAEDDMEDEEMQAEFAKNGGISLTWPVPSCVRVSTLYWYYTHTSKTYGNHTHGSFNGTNFQSIDIPAPLNSVIVAAESGTVIENSSDGSRGYYLRIRHADGSCTGYFHMKEAGLPVGTVVAKGQEIGRSGDTGNSDGPHLHFEWTGGDPWATFFKDFLPRSAYEQSVIVANTNEAKGICELGCSKGCQQSQFFIAFLNGNHVHNYTQPGHDAAHPHATYKACSCGAKSYDNGTVSVSGCGTCDKNAAPEASVQFAPDARFNGFVPFYTYAISTGRVPVFNNKLQQESNHYIDGANDVITVHQVYTNGYCEVTYPGSTTHRYVRSGDLIPNGGNSSVQTAEAKFDAYRRSTGASTIGTVAKGDVCMTFSTENNRIQVIYPISGGHKMGWVSADSRQVQVTPAITPSYNGPTYLPEENTTPAINENGGNDKPFNSNFRVENITKTSFTFRFDASDKSGIGGVILRVVNMATGDIVADNPKPTSVSGTTYSWDIRVPAPGKFQIWVQTWDSFGNASEPGGTEVMTAGAAPVFSNVHVTNMNSTGFVVTADVYSEVGGLGFTGNVWVEGTSCANYSGPTIKDLGNGHYLLTRTIRFSEYQNAKGLYHVELTAKDAWGQASGRAVNVYAGTTIPTRPTWTVTDVDASGMTVTCILPANVYADHVNFFVGTVSDGSDLKNYTVRENNGTEGRYSFRIPASEFPGKTGFYVHMHVYDKCFPDKLITNICPDHTSKLYITIPAYTAPTLKAEPTVSNVGPDGYTVDFDVAASCALTSVEVQTHISGAEGVYTSAADKTASGYSCRIHTGDHDGAAGQYISEIYAADATGNRVLLKTVTVTVEPEELPALPEPEQPAEEPEKIPEEIPAKSDALAILEQPRDAEANAGDTVLFTVCAAGQSLNYFWQSKTPTGGWVSIMLDGYNTNTLRVPAAAGRDGTMYRCIVMDGTGNRVISEPAMLKVAGFAILSQPQSVTADLNSTVSFHVSVNGANLTYQWQFRSLTAASWCKTTAAGYNTDTLRIPATAGRNGYQYRCIISDDAGSQVISDAALLKVNAQKEESAAITAQPVSVIAAANTTADFHVAVSGTGLTYQWQFKSPAGSWSKTTTAGYNTDTIHIPVTAGRNGYQYRCIITTASGAKLTSEGATLTVGGSTILTQPQSRIAAQGSSVSFHVEASGTGLTYQWQFKSPTGSWSKTTAAGYNTDTLTIPATAGRNGYQYRCIITDAAGTKLTSEAALLTVERFSIMSQPQSMTAELNRNAVFHVEAAGANLTYQWQFRTLTGSWCKTTAAGYNTDTLTIPATAGRNGYQYRCIITNAAGDKLTSDAATLMVIR